MTAGERIKHLRKALGLSADELGAMIGKDRSTIYRYERGEIESATIDVLPRLAQALQTTPQYIMGWEDKPVFCWASPAHTPELSALAEQWGSWALGRRWSAKEVDLFIAQAHYIMRIKDAENYDSILQFLETFYNQLK